MRACLAYFENFEEVLKIFKGAQGCYLKFFETFKNLGFCLIILQNFTFKKPYFIVNHQYSLMIIYYEHFS